MALDDISAAISAADAGASTTSTTTVPVRLSPAAATFTPPPHPTLSPPPQPESRPLADPHAPSVGADTEAAHDDLTSTLLNADDQSEPLNPNPNAAIPPLPTQPQTDAAASPQEYVSAPHSEQVSPQAAAHAQLQNGDAGSSASPAMSHGQHNGEMGRSLASYAHAQNAYTSPGTQSGGYMYSSGQSSTDAYRASPGAPISLPSVKTFDPLSQQTQQQLPPPQQQQQQLPQGNHMQGHLPHHLQHQHQPHAQSHQAPQTMHMTSSVPHAPAISNLLPHSYMPIPPQNPYQFPIDQVGQRYAIPPHDPRFRGPKKEIKRRTKTGCLTCRKRRIKCDEAQPTCNNCKKSKRDCLGYDPIFKSQQGPSGLQIATNSIPSSNKSLVSAPTLPSSIPSGPPPSSNPYGNQPAVLPSSYGPQVVSAPPQAFDPSHTTGSPPIKGEGYEYSQSIDPALHHNLPSLTSAAPAASHQPGLGVNSHLRAKKMKVEEIIGLLGPMPDVPPVTLTDDLFKEIVRVYHEVYVQGLNNFFETDWFQHKDPSGIYTFPNDQNVVNVFAAFLHMIQRAQPTNHAAMVSSGVLEARLIWALATLPYALCPAASNASASVMPYPADGIEARNRVLVIQTLLNGDTLMDNPLARPTNDPQNLRTREFHFWYTLAEYLRCGDDRSPAMMAKREEHLGQLRRLLDGRENRDLLYSIAIARDLSPLVEPGYEHTVPQHHDESNPKNKLFVASNFIRQEAQVAGGTTNVVRRLSEIAIQAFIHPGVNIAKLPTLA